MATVNKKYDIPVRLLKMDRSSFTVIDKKSISENETYWLSQPFEDRFWAIEILRMQFMEMNNLSPKMDRTYFEIRK